MPPDVHLAFRAEFIPHNSPWMPWGMVIALLLSIALAVLTRDRNARLCAAAAGLSIVACFLVTMFGNVPINDEIRSWDPAAPPTDYLSRLRLWDLLHDIRTTVVIIGFILLVLAVVLPRSPETTPTARATGSKQAGTPRAPIA
ncbi:anthrone oxygenase family protein [Nocardia sp. CA-119907]|uniref:anthrone oxygenase family protein n=1 Tax=Nocardia sp. CA-119907 TaxID=3239973 RepID=UPI003D99EEA5